MKQFLLNIPEDLYLEAKRIALEKRIALADILRQALREEVAMYKKQEKTHPIQKNILLQMAAHAFSVGKKVSFAKDIDTILYEKP